MVENHNNNKKKNLPNFFDILKLLDNISKDRQLLLGTFDTLCSNNCLNIEIEIKLYAKRLLRQNDRSFKKIKGLNRIKVYIATLFVSYVSLGYDFKDIISKIKYLLKISTNNARIRREFKTLIYYLSKMIKTIEQGHFKIFLTATFLNKQQRDEFMTNYYKIKITEFLEDLNENFYPFKDYNINLEDLLDPIIYIIKNCNDQFTEKYRASRLASACYYIFSVIKKLQRINQYSLKKDFFFRTIGSSIHSLEEHLKKIDIKLDKRKFAKLFQDRFEFI